MSKSKFYDRIHTATIEKDVEEAYNEGLKKYFKNVEIKHPHACDSFIDTVTDAGKYLKLLVEYKFDEKLNAPAARAKVLVQVLYYLQRFEQAGEILPNVVLVGDVNECFVIHTNSIAKYLDEQVNWSIAPSDAAVDNPDLVLKIANDADIVPFVYDVNEFFSFKNVAEQIIALADNVQRLVRVTEHNISRIYDYFVDKVIINQQKIEAHDLVGIFIGIITDHENYFQHPSTPTILMANGKKYNIDANAYKAFFNYFNRDYSMSERSKFTEIADRLIEDTNRRKSGDFFTPTPFVDYAHKMLNEQLGDDWRDKYVVWDCCWGTGNLTRDYKFNELYASTLKESELQMGEHYNPEAIKFQMDFLNDPIEPDLYGTKVPQSLLNALKEDKPIIFFINPPFASVANREGNGNKTGAVTTLIQKQMKNMGKASANLYAQFLYRICLIKRHYGLSNIVLATYSPTLFLCGSGYALFRKYFFDEFSFEDGIVFNASHFADVSEIWGISFSIWKAGISDRKDSFPYKLVDFIDGNISLIGKKELYNVDFTSSCREWAKAPVQKDKLYNKLPLRSAINIGNTKGTKISEDAFGCYVNNSNIVNENTMSVFLLTSSYNSVTKPSFTVSAKNIDRVCANFAARKLIIPNWINSKDEYIAPNEQHEKWQEYVNDSTVFSLFHSSSNQSSLRDIEYKGKIWNIKNEFFFMSKRRIMELADANNYAATYEDARTDTERYVFQQLQKVELSAEAKGVLDKAIELTEKTFKYRQLFNQEHPEYQIMNWDCGWYQIKALVDNYAPNDLKEFNLLFKNLSDKMRPVVYELGFLK